MPMLDITDRRKNPKDKSLVNRQRFLRRHREKVTEAVRERIREAGIRDIASRGATKVKIKAEGTQEPVFRHGAGGVTKRVLPGNREYRAGDRIPRPERGRGRGSEGAPEGEGEDDFVFEVTHKEFLEYFFEGLELPDMVKRALAGEDQFVWQRAGYSVDGSPANLDTVRTLRQSQARRLAFRISKLRRKRELEEELGRLRSEESANAERIAEIEEEIRVLERQIRAIPFLDDTDVRYRRHEKVPVPVAQAVMFCILDVSGSMGPWEKEMSKRFFMLLYLFLTRAYDRVEVVFIRHHHAAKEVSEEEFFRSRESGGTIVSTALALMLDIVEERYPTSRWNIYGCHASDGDNYSLDRGAAERLMAEAILPLAQYFAYVEVDPRGRYPHVSELWPVYQEARKVHHNLGMARITDACDIYPVFRGLFDPRHKEEAA